MDKNNIAPRVGLAFRLSDKSVIRGGWGLYYPTSAAQGVRDPLATNGFNQGLTKRNTEPMATQNHFSPGLGLPTALAP